jgi:hypothetical protein
MTSTKDQVADEFGQLFRRREGVKAERDETGFHGLVGVLDSATALQAGTGFGSSVSSIVVVVDLSSSTKKDQKNSDEGEEDKGRKGVAD